MECAKIRTIFVEKLHFLDCLNFLPISLKNMPNHLTSHVKKCTTRTFLIRPTNSTILNPSSMGQTTCQVMSEPSFWNCTRSKKTNFCNIQELFAYCMDDDNVLLQACCALRNLFLKLVTMDPFRQAIKVSSICSKVFRTMFLKLDTVGIIPRAEYRMVDRHSDETLQ